MAESTYFYITRVELHGANEAQYEVLHRAMTNLGFTRKVTHDGNTLQLPSAEYAIRSAKDINQIRDQAVAAAITTRLKFWVIVSGASRFAQHGLPLA